MSGKISPKVSIFVPSRASIGLKSNFAILFQHLYYSTIRRPWSHLLLTPSPKRLSFLKPCSAFKVHLHLISH